MKKFLRLFLLLLLSIALFGCESQESLFEAVENNNLEKVTALILEEGEDINQTSNTGDTALHIAAFLGHLEIAKFLLENEIDASILNNNGEDAMFLAAYVANATMVSIMLEFDVDFLNTTNDGLSAYDIVSIAFDDELKQSYIDLGEFIGYEFNLLRVELDRKIVKLLFDTYLDENSK